MGLVNLFNKSKEKEKSKGAKVPRSLLGVSAINSYAIGLAEETYPNPDVVLANQGLGIDAYYNLLYDAHVKSCVQSRKSGVLSLEWDIDREKKPTPETEFIKEIYKRLKMENIIADMLDAVLYGYKPMEIYWRPVYGLKINGEYQERDFIIPDAVVGKPPHWFEFDYNGVIRMKETYMRQEKQLLARKFIVVQHGASGDNPYGQGIMANCYWPVTFKKSAFTFWTQYLEKYGQPFLDASVQDGDSQELEEVKKQLFDMRNGGVLAHDQDVTITAILANSTQAGLSYGTLIHYLNSEMSKAILSQTLTTEQGSTGSYAMSKTHLEVRKEVVDSDARLIEHYLNEFNRWIIEYNFPDADHIPEFGLYEEEDVNKELADRDALFLQTGKIKFSKDYFAKRYGWKPDEFEVIEQPDPADNTQNSHENGLMQYFSEGDGTFDQKLEESLTGANEKMLRPIIKMIQEQKSYDEIEKKILSSFSEIDETEAMEIFEAAMLAGNLTGQLKHKE
ncbi:MAG: phage portal protein family protein [Bacteroidota bacterium]